MSGHLNVDHSLKSALENLKATSTTRITTADPLFTSAFLITQSLIASARPYHVVVTPDSSSAQQVFRYLNLLKDLNSPQTMHVHFLPGHDISPYSGLYSSRQAMLERMGTLYRTAFATPGTVIVTSAKAMAQKIMPQELFVDHCFEYQKGQDLPSELPSFLSRLGYQNVPIVEDPGSFTIRGGIVDIFSPSQPHPVRIELFGDTIESLRHFDARNQHSLGEISSFEIIPAHEVLFTDEGVLSCCQQLAGKTSEADITALQAQVRNQTYFDGIEFLLPHFYKKLSPLSDYLPSGALFWWPDAIAAESQYVAELSLLQEEYKTYATHVPPPTELYVDTETLKGFSKGQKIDLETLDISDTLEKNLIEFPSRTLAPAKAATFSERLDVLVKKIQEWKGARSAIFVFGHSETQFKRLSYVLQSQNFDLQMASPPLNLLSLKQRQSDSRNLVHFITGDFHTSFHALTEATVFVGFEHYLKKLENKASSIKAELSKAEALSFSELREGDPVVHQQHGVAIYLGLKVMNLMGVDAEFLELKFKDNDKLFLPIYRLNQVHKYTGAGHSPLLDKLGGKSWEKTKAKVQTRLREVANELVQLYAKRQTIQREPYDVHGADLVAFEEAFPYEETPDQLKAMQDLRDDLGRDRPMDRLICGDVGFGKTEIAMRAAFLAASQRRQVAVLAPTTILTFQHYETFKKRFRDWPIQIAVLNRFVTNAEAQKILVRLKNGEVDILIGTHRLLSQDVHFKNLGLMIIDEEQKFGVKHKERLRHFKNSVDTLAMSATPIPRTLNMSLLGIRDLTLINTPPHDRLPTRTFVSKFDLGVIRKSVLAEVKRGGQIFFLHNRVQSIYGLADELRQLLPKVRMAVAHGQMSEDELEKTIVSFFNKEIDMLICTTIIESGMDIPNANTMFVDQAHALGLSQLYQLRGRVGRSKQRAFCYLLIPRGGNIDDVAKERLRILQQNTALGSGIQIAQYDLELRGAGTLLGEEQAGSVDAIGYEMYMDLLEQAIQEAKGQPAEEVLEPEINLKIKALIPHAYMPDIRLRLSYYKALSGISAVEDLDKIEEELRDQFGQPPEEVFNLMGLMTLRLLCKELGIRDVSSGATAISLVFSEKTKLSPNKVVELSLLPNKKYSITPDHRLKVRMNTITWQNIFEELTYLKKFCT